MAISPNAQIVFADGPASNPVEPRKADIRALLTQYENLLFGITNSGGLIYASRASLFGDLSKAANSMAWVMGDPVSANNGIYRKNGASGAGSWTRVAELPYSVIVASDTDAGNPNSIVAISSVPILTGAFVIIDVAETNTASPVFISFNGNSALRLKSSSGNDIAAGGIVAGMQLVGVVRGSTFRLLTDQVSSAIVASAEAFSAASAASAAAAAAAAAGVSLPPVAGTDAYKILTPKSDGTGHQIFASYKNTMKRLRVSAARNRVFWAGQNNSYVGTGGVSGGTTAAGRTFVHDKVTRGNRQDGYIRRVSLNIPVNGGDASNSFRALILRPNGASFDVIASSAVIAIGAGTGIKTFELPAPIGPALAGDRVGVWMSGGAGATSWQIASNSGSACLFISGLATGGETYTLTADADLCLFALGSSPLLVTHGDSIIAGHNGGSGHQYFSGAEATGPAGERDSDPVYQAVYRSGLNLAGIDYQNNGIGGATWSTMITAINNWTLANSLVPKMVLINCGVNDIAGGRTWAQVEADMYTVLGILSGVDRLFVNEIIPWPETETPAATIRDWNQRYAAWCEINGAILVPVHDPLAQVRSSTGLLDDPKYSMSSTDGHLTKAGVDVMGRVIAETVLANLI